MSFTHNLDFQFNGQTIEGEIEFDGDGEVSFLYSNDPILKLVESGLLNDLYAILQRIYALNYSLVKIEIVEKE